MSYPEDYFRPMLGKYRIDSTPTIIKRQTVTTVTLRIHERDKICFAYVDDNYQDKADKQGRGNSPDNYAGSPIALMRITEPETDDYEARLHQRTSTLHVMLSDGNIIRLAEPNISQRTVANPVNRVYRAIMGAILTLCDDAHVLDSGKLWEADSTNIPTGQQTRAFENVLHHPTIDLRETIRWRVPDLPSSSLYRRGSCCTHTFCLLPWQDLFS